ncbi:hypothetical protein BD779DRAFT_1502773 [Infundibulicybe gibba]|nr:hypothetical protein BD779DRAFT_1502773 [Infundibulicybe gibba]
MYDTSVTDGAVPFHEPTVTSMLGVKGPLRFRPHGSSQKPHIILRRVVISDESSDSGEVDNVVRFSFFAQKRIEVKPGKEILLTVASEDGRFKDQPIIFVGDPLASDATSDEEVETQVAEEEDAYIPPIAQAIPPKMRRAWTKKVEEVSPLISEPLTYNTVGVQAEPDYSSTSIQVEPSYTSSSSQVEIPCSSKCIQADLSPLRTSSAAQTTIPRRDATVGIQAERSSTAEALTVPGLSRDRISNTEQPLSYGALFPGRLAASSVASSSGAQDMQFSPVELRETARRLDSATLFSLPRLPPRTNRDEASAQRRSLLSPVNTAQAPDVTPSQPKPVSDLKPTPPTAPLSRPFQNPFVSAGFMVQFNGEASTLATTANIQPKVIVIDITQSESERKVAGVVQSLPTCPPAKKTALEPQTTVYLQNAPSQNVDGTKASLNRPNTQPRAPSNRLTKLRKTRGGNGRRRSAQSMPSIAPAPPQSPFYSPSSDTPSLSAVLPYHSPSASKIDLSNGASSDIPPFRLAESPDSALSLSGTTGRFKPLSPVDLPPVSTRPSPNMHISHPLLAGHPGALDTDYWGNRLSDPTQQGIPIPSTQVGPSKTPISNGIDYELSKPNHEERGQPVPNNIHSLGSSLSWTSTSSSSSPPPSKWKVLPLSEDFPPSQTETRPRLTRDSPEELQHLQKPNHDHSSSGSVVGHAPVKTAPGDRTLTRADRSIRCTCEFSPDGQLSVSSGRRWGRSQHSSLCALWDIRKSLEAPEEKDNPTESPSINTTANPAPSLDSRATSRGVKRERPPTPDLSGDGPPPRRKRPFNWPTVDSFYSLDLKGDGDLAIHNIAFSFDGGYFAIACGDRTIRIWNSRSRAEIARLSHNANVVSVRWMEGDTAVISLGEDGIVSKWTKTGQNQWQWAKVLDTGNKRQAGDDVICLAYMRDRIAVSYPRFGVKVWVWLKGTWQAQRSILRQNVTAIKFVEDGTALLGGTKDGVLWYTEIPNGTLRAFAFLLSRITSIDITPNGSHALIGQEGRAARLVGIRQANRKGSVEQSYSCKDTETRFNSTFGAIFATRGEAVLFGSVDGCALVWDRKKGNIVYALEHDDDDQILSIASYDGLTSRDGYLITGTKRGHLAWWLQPAAAPQQAEDEGSKRMKFNGS